MVKIMRHQQANKVKCTNSKYRKEIKIGNEYDVIAIVSDSKGVKYYKIVSDIGKIRHYEISRFEVIN